MTVHCHIPVIEYQMVWWVCRFVSGASFTEPTMYSHFRNYAPPLDEKGGIIMEKVLPVFSERVFRACFGLVI